MSRKVFIVVEAPEAVAVVIGDFHKGAEGSGTSVTLRRQYISWRDNTGDDQEEQSVKNPNGP